MEPIRINPYTMIYIGLGIGFVAGLILLLLGWFKGRTKLGVFGLLASVFGGGLLGILLVIPVFALFLWLVLHKSSGSSSTTADVAAAADAEQGSSNGI